jgi:hypothetical protein
MAQHFLYFFPLPHGQSSLRPILIPDFLFIRPSLSGKVNIMGTGSDKKWLTIKRVEGKYGHRQKRYTHRMATLKQSPEMACQ